MQGRAIARKGNKAGDNKIDIFWMDGIEYTVYYSLTT